MGAFDHVGCTPRTGYSMGHFARAYFEVFPAGSYHTRGETQRTKRVHEHWKTETISLEGEALRLERDKRKIADAQGRIGVYLSRVSAKDPTLTESEALAEYAELRDILVPVTLWHDHKEALAALPEIPKSTFPEEKMTPHEAVRENYEFPFELYPFQIETVNQLADSREQQVVPATRVGHYHEAGAGKTATSTYWMLYQNLTQGITQWLIVVPPILLTQWRRWVTSIRNKRNGKPLTAVVYAGTPATRERIPLTADFIITSYGLMKNDYEKLRRHLMKRRYGILADEAHAIKNVRSKTYKVFRDIVAEAPATVLTGTPLTTPWDAYAYTRFTAPVAYRNLHHFELQHVAAKDTWGTVTRWQDMEGLSRNLLRNSSRVLRRDVQKQLPPITFTPVVYDLSPEHIRLYQRIAQEKLVEFEDGREINAISAQALFSALQQVIVNWSEFADDETKVPAVLELIEETLEELGEGKLVVVGNFIRTNRYLHSALARYGAVAVYGEISASQKQYAIERFINEPTCRVIILQPRSGGFGVDGLQKVCSDMLFVEAPTVPPPFYQTAARLDRDGQTRPVNCRVAIANSTVQVRMFKSLLANDELINSVQGGYENLREAINGH